MGALVVVDELTRQRRRRDTLVDDAELHASRPARCWR